MSRARDIANYGDGIDTSSITSGTFADARIAASNVTQHEGSIDALASNPTITLGSNATFPNGTLVKSEFYKYTGGDYDTTSTTIKASQNFQSFSCTVGNTIIFQFNFMAEMFRNSGTENGRRGIIDVYQSTTSVSQDADLSSSSGLNEMVLGRILHEASSAGANVYLPVLIQGSFVATNATHYLGLGAKTLTATNTTLRVTKNSSRPLTLSIYEFKGDVLT